VKYRKGVLTARVASRLKEINFSVAEKFGIQIIEQETDMDHIHILFASKPQIQLSKFVNSLKSVSARLLFREFPELKRELWENRFWSRSYFLSSVGEVKLEDVKRYVQSQGDA
jgi:putative transposase